MRCATWLGYVLLVAACTRENEAFDGGDGASSTRGDATKGGSLEGPGTEPGTGPGAGTGTGGADGTTTVSMTTGPSTGNANDSTTLGSPTGTDDSATMTTGSGGMDSPACCTPGQACEIAKITGCVCDERPACCEGEWDLSCVATGVALGCIDRACMSPPTSCCAQSDQPGCDDFEIMACVCADHLTCCTQEWNGTCVMAVEECPEVQCP